MTDRVAKRHSAAQPETPTRQTTSIAPTPQPGLSPRPGDAEANHSAPKRAVTGPERARARSGHARSSKQQRRLRPGRVPAAARIRPTQHRAGAPSGAPGLLLCQEAGVSPCAPGRRPRRASDRSARRRSPTCTKGGRTATKTRPRRVPSRQMVRPLRTPLSDRQFPTTEMGGRLSRRTSVLGVRLVASRVPRQAA
jgi:hypothetical protein